MTNQLRFTIGDVANATATIQAIDQTPGVGSASNADFVEGVYQLVGAGDRFTPGFDEVSETAADANAWGLSDVNFARTILFLIEQANPTGRLIWAPTNKPYSPRLNKPSTKEAQS